VTTVLCNTASEMLNKTDLNERRQQRGSSAAFCWVVARLLGLMAIVLPEWVSEGAAGVIG
jgi:hypothetical protein